MPSLVLIALLVALIHVYNVWAGLQMLYLGRRTIAAIGIGMLIFGPAMLLRRPAQFLYLAIASVCLSAVFMIHFLYSAYAGGFLSISSLRYIKQVSALGSTMQALMGSQLLFFATPMIAVAILIWLRPRHITATTLSNRTRLGLVVLMVTIPLLSAGYVFASEAYDEKGNISHLLNHPLNSDELVGKIGIVNYTIYDAIKYTFRKKGLTQAERTYVTDRAGQFRFKTEGTAYAGSQQGKNVIFIQLESIQQFLINQDVGGQPVMPNLREIAGQSTSFTNFHYTVGPGTSSDAEFTTLNSLMHLGDTAAYFEYPANHYEALPAVLGRAGYTTAAYHGDSKNFWNRAIIYPTFGYQAFYGVEDYTPREHGIAWGISDRDFFSQTATMLPRLKEPYFAHLITLSSHTPFSIPQQYRQLETKNVVLSPIQKDYLHAAHYTDAALGEFVARLKAQGLWDKSVVVLMGDHEGFITPDKNDDAFAHFLGYANGFDDLSFLRARQIPFIIHAPGLPATGLDIPGSQLDIYPTLTNILGVPTPPSVLGRDLLNTQTPLVARRRRALGIDLEMVLGPNLSYVGTKGSSNFQSGRCYEGQAMTDLERCRLQYQQAYDRIELSDLVVTGNALNLLK